MKIDVRIYFFKLNSFSKKIGYNDGKNTGFMNMILKYIS